MSYTVLARKLRPAGFDALVGQEHVIKALKHGLDHDRLHHAYLFTGTRGVGKTTIARILAKCLNCEKGVSSTPCGQCSVCTEVAENRFMDLIEVDAASRTGIDDTRDLLDNAQYLPTSGRYKVYLIDEVHMLSRASFNALLKTLEEPPPHVKFLLATTDPKKVPVTVLSRCLQFQLKNLSAESIAQYLAKVLTQEAVEFENDATHLIGKSAQGSMRDALSITDQAIGFGGGKLLYQDVADMLGAVGRNELDAVMSALAGGQASEILRITADLSERSADFQTVLGDVIGSLHAMAVDHAVNGGGDTTFDPETVQLFYQIAVMGYRDMSIVPDPRTGFEMTLLRMLAFAPQEQSIPRLEPRGIVVGAKTETPRQTSANAPPTPSSGPRPQLDAPTQLDLTRVEMPEMQASFWYDLVATLPLSGVSKMIVEHSVLLERTNERWFCVLDQAHDMLLNDAQVAAISRAVSEHIGSSVQMSIVIGSIASETPAARALRINALRQQHAQSVLESDKNVRSLLDVFDGRLEGVSPVSADRTGNRTEQQ